MKKKVKPALILGNGPSAKTVDFDNTEMFDVFGMNAAYRYWHKISMFPDYYSCLDLVVGLSHKDEIADLVRRREQYGIRKFLLRDNLISVLGEDVCSPDIVINFDKIRDSTGPLAARPVTTGSHTLAWAMSLGYRKAFVIGVDCDYVQIIDEATLQADGTLLISENPTQPENYFFDGYQQVGDRYNVPDPSDDLHIVSWRNVAAALPRECAVVNLNPNSKMDAFEFNSWDNALADIAVTMRSKTSIADQFKSKIAGLIRKR